MLFISLLIGYLVGSIPFGYLLGRLKGVDIRRSGSGNIGATNALRVLGPAFGLLALFLDVGKGVLAVYLGRLVGGPMWGGALGGMAGLVGHAWSVFLRFGGGKVVATTAGVLGMLLPVSLYAGLAVFILAVILTRYVSLGSMLAALAVAVSAFLSPVPLPDRLTAFFAAALILLRHRSNLHRLLQGTERRFGERAERSN